jgi:hypothetical protein
MGVNVILTKLVAFVTTQSAKHIPRGIIFMLPDKNHFMLEQQLINSFMKFTSKAGAGEFVRMMIQEYEENGNPKVWTENEMHHAINFLEDLVQKFGKHEAAIVITTLMRKFEISIEDLHVQHAEHEHTDEFSGVKGLQ